MLLPVLLILILAGCTSTQNLSSASQADHAQAARGVMLESIKGFIASLPIIRRDTIQVAISDSDILAPAQELDPPVAIVDSRIISGTVIMKWSGPNITDSDDWYWVRVSPAQVHPGYGIRLSWIDVLTKRQELAVRLSELRCVDEADEIDWTVTRVKVVDATEGTTFPNVTVMPVDDSTSMIVIKLPKVKLPEAIFNIISEAQLVQRFTLWTGITFFNLANH